MRLEACQTWQQIVGIGPAFILPVLGKSAKTGSQLRFVFGVIRKMQKVSTIVLKLTIFQAIKLYDRCSISNFFRSHSKYDHFIDQC